MFDLAPRFPEHSEVDSSPVGPTTYIIGDIECKKSKGSCFPFNTTNDRFEKLRTSDAPSPSSYYPKYRKHRILGGKSMRYSSPRICIVPKKKESIPYPFASQQQNRFTETNFYLRKSTNIYRGTVPNIFKIQPSKNKLGVSPASEKILREAYISQPLPDYLKFPGEISKASLKYRGSKWSQFKTKRHDLALANDFPGPAAYNIRKMLTEKKQKDTSRTNAHILQKNVTSISKDQSNVNETVTSEQEIIKTTHFFDGTCDYLYKKVSHNKNPSGIWAKTERFITKENNDSPAPCQYYPKPEKCLRKIVKLVPFCSCTPRFKSPIVTDISPASYNQQYGTIFGRSCSQVAKIWGSLRAPFGSTAPRITLPPSQESEEEEEPVNQDFLCVKQISPTNTSFIPPPKQITEQEQIQTIEDDMYQIIGTSLQITDGDSKEDFTPLVDIRESYARYKNKKTFRKPIENEGFLSVSRNRADWIIQRTPAHGVSWPPITDVKVAGGALKMNYPQYNKKSSQKKDESVFYDIHPRYSSSVYKSTHNYRLKKHEIEKTYDDPDNVKTILKCFMPKEILYA